jgi:flagellar protein FliO/FliZ
MQSDFAFSMIKMLSALALVLGLMLVLFYLIKKTWWRGSGFGRNSIIRVLAHQTLGPRKAIAVVNVAGEYIVVGFGKDHLSMLGKVESPEAIEILLSLDKQREGKQFAGILGNLLERRKGDAS